MSELQFNEMLSISIPLYLFDLIIMILTIKHVINWKK